LEGPHASAVVPPYAAWGSVAILARRPLLLRYPAPILHGRIRCQSVASFPSALLCELYGCEFYRIVLRIWPGRKEVFVRQQQRITIDPDLCGGRPCVRGLRIRVKDILELLAAGATRDEILADYPYLEAEDITAVLDYAAHQADHPIVCAA
jgi:uncharacterized protein (DUF433 family)